MAATTEIRYTPDQDNDPRRPHLDRHVYRVPVDGNNYVFLEAAPAQKRYRWDFRVEGAAYGESRHADTSPGHFTLGGFSAERSGNVVTLGHDDSPIGDNRFADMVAGLAMDYSKGNGAHSYAILKPAIALQLIAKHASVTGKSLEELGAYAVSREMSEPSYAKSHRLMFEKEAPPKEHELLTVTLTPTMAALTGVRELREDLVFTTDTDEARSPAAGFSTDVYLRDLTADQTVALKQAFRDADIEYKIIADKAEGSYKLLVYADIGRTAHALARASEVGVAPSQANLRVTAAFAEEMSKLDAGRNGERAVVLPTRSESTAANIARNKASGSWAERGEKSSGAVLPDR